MPEDINKNDKYDASKIQKLEGLEGVRKRPDMYIGDTNERGLHHCVFEIVDNSIDEALAGYCTQIKVSVHTDGSCSIEDNGRGIPVDIHPKYKIPALELVMTNLHAGGKFGKGAYQVSGGLHGVGAKCVNAVSEHFEVEVRKDGKIYKTGLMDDPNRTERLYASGAQFSIEIIEEMSPLLSFLVSMLIMPKITAIMIT